MSNKPIVQRITAKLNSLAIEKECSYQELLTQFLIERLVVRITHKDQVNNQIIFKGGYVSLRVYDSPRYTKDIDATVQISIDTVVKDIKSIIEKHQPTDCLLYTSPSPRDS